MKWKRYTVREEKEKKCVSLTVKKLREKPEVEVMGSGASLAQEKHVHVYKKESVRFQSSVKSDLDKGMAFLRDVNQFLRDEGKELKDTRELRDMLQAGCDKLSELLCTFKTDEVFDVLERVDLQKKIEQDTAGLHSIIHGFAGIHSASRKRLSVKTPVPLKKRRLPAHPDVSSMTLQKIMTLPPQRPTKFKLDRMKSVRRMKNPKLEKIRNARHVLA